MIPLKDSPYSFHFNTLSMLGSWVYETKNPRVAMLMVMWRFSTTALCLYGSYCLLLDLYMVLDDFKKITWNLSITLFFIGSLTKNFQLLQHIYPINKLRNQLHYAEQSRMAPDDIAVCKSALQELKYLRMSFYGGAGVFVPTWLISRYFSYLWGPKELPIPMRLPFEVDLENNAQYNYVFFGVGFFGILGISLVTETEMAMFTIFIQISREYNVLIKDIPKINEYYEDCYYVDCLEPGKSAQKEINPCLREEKTKILLKELSSRQQKIIEYTEAFENCYNSPMLVQLFGMSVLLSLNGFQCLLVSDDFTGNIFFQLGYVVVLLVDLFLICWFCTKLRSQCFEVGEAAYSTFWYRMSTNIQRDINMMIMRAQHPPKITTGKIMELNLNVFMHRMNNIYSWVALFRQLQFAQ